MDDRALALPISVRRAIAGGSGAGGEAGAESNLAGRGGASAGGALPIGPSGGAVGNAGHAGTAGVGSMGSGGAGPPILLKCPDLNGNRVLDCEESLAQNGDFAQNLEFWLPDPHITQTWAAEQDAGSYQGSGAVKVQLTVVSSTSILQVVEYTRQCISITPGTYDVGVQLFIAGGQGTGNGGLALRWFSSSNCTTPGFLSVAEGGSTSEVGKWTTLSQVVTAPDNAQSVLFSLGVTKPFQQPSFEVLFDNALLVKR
ncbi:MAG: hypothetical protein SFV15_20185 [Polyangiaceae bacterium]|nr:hypothetical protein [Polyangiaceae bacterium]